MSEPRGLIVPTPVNGCRHCGLPERGSRSRLPHAQRWTDEVGWHTWTQPTQDQIKQRMKARRTVRGQSASLVIIDEAVNWQPSKGPTMSDTCTELTCPHHGAANRAAQATQRDTEQPKCEWFRWIGQPFYSCDRCGRPAWEHLGEEVPDTSNPFSDEPPGHREWEPGQADDIRAKWEHCDG
ncbi:hypothetical protein ACQP1V_43200 (plasmid) [Microtetraspora malaysiensis]|uniref:hypothetical protein n=1 Tax=Microtetraspora malaysiensis TaxID=161358 RepID=UPI003D8D7309